MNFVLRRRWVGVVLAVLGLAGVVRAEGKGGGKCFMWKVTGGDGGQVVYLLGSIHAGSEDMYPLPKEIEGAFAESKKLVVEADIGGGNPLAMLGTLAAKGFYTEKGDGLAKHVKPETVGKVEAYIKENHLPAMNVEKARPWMVGMMLEGFSVQAMGLQTELGVDLHFLNLARGKKKIGELESVEQQAAMLAALDDGTAEQFLLSCLQDPAEAKKQIEELKELWKDGAAEEMAETLAKGDKAHPEMAGFNKKLLEDRNVKMVEKVEGYMKEKGAVFVVVGAAHLVGEKGIVAVLKGKGLRVEQVGKE